MIKIKRNGFFELLYSGLVLFIAGGFSVAHANDVTMTSLLNEMVNRDDLARVPSISYTQHMASSYNRAQVIPTPAYSGPHNNDWVGFIRTETNQGRTEYVMMEHNGPGAITRMWAPSSSVFAPILKNNDIYRFYIDGSSTPVIEAKFDDLLSGKGFIKEPFAFAAHDLGEAYRSKGVNLYFPIPFANSIKVTRSENVELPFFIINYRTYAPGTSVQSFTMAEYNSLLNTTIKTTGDALRLQNYSVNQGAIQETTETLNSNQSMTLDLPAGSKAIKYLEVELPSNATPQMLRSTILKVTVDNVETVWSPLGEFFGTGYRLANVQDWYRSATKDGTLISRWVMPYQNNAKVEMENLGGSPVSVTLKVGTDSWAWDSNSMHFYARWRKQNNVVTGLPPEWNYIEISGQGKYVGDTLTVHSPRIANKRWWGEGDKRIWIDKVRDYSTVGTAGADFLDTGTEDHYSFAYGWPAFFSNPFISMPNRDAKREPDVDYTGYSTISRVRMLDDIPFLNSFIFDMEVWSWVAADLGAHALEYHVTTFWYGRPGATHNRPKQEANAAAAATASTALQEYEGEYLMDSTTVDSGPTPSRQKLTGQGWSNDEQMFWQSTAANQSINTTIFVPVAGTYQLKGKFITAADYGQFNFALDGVSLANNIDLYSSSLSTSLKDLGSPIALDAGFHTIKVTTAGKNAASSNHFYGVDYYQTTLASGSAPSTITIEGEDLTVGANTGAATQIQNFPAFGWSGDMQLWWPVTSAGNTLELNFNVALAGNYGVSVNLTRAADYGNLKFFLNGTPLTGVDFAGYNNGVITNLHSLGNLTLLPGQNTLTLEVIGKDASSSNYFAGIDYLELVPESAPPASTNIAPNGTATQSSTWSGNVASRAIDGNTNGNWGAGESTHTDLGSQPYWTLDLGSVENIQTIRLWNRTDCCSSRLTDFHVFVSDTPFSGTTVSTSQNQSGVFDYHNSGTAGTTTNVAVNRSGRYVRIQLSNTAVTGENVLSLAEVEVFGN